MSESYEISACEEGGNLVRLSLTTPGNIIYPDPPEVNGTDAEPIGFAIDSAGSSWAVFTSTKWATPPVTCDRSPARLYEWSGNRWAVKGKGVLAWLFGPRDQMVVIRGQLPSSGPAQWSGTLVVDNAGHHVDVASGVVAVSAGLAARRRPHIHRAGLVQFDAVLHHRVANSMTSNPVMRGCQ